MAFWSQSFPTSNDVVTEVSLRDTDAGPKVANEDFSMAEGKKSTKPTELPLLRAANCKYVNAQDI